MRILSILLLFILSFPLAGRVVAQDCTDPDGDVGVLRYNLDYGVLQGCTPKNWVSLHSAICPDGDACIDPCDDSPALGTMCDDGSYYIGLSPENGAKTFMTSAAHEGSGIRWDNAGCYRCGDGTIATSQTDGRANTNALLAFNATGFDAAAHCEGLNATSAHGHTDWYLPAGGPYLSSSEINLIWLTVQSAGGVGGLNTSGSWYWSSSEVGSGYAIFRRFSGGGQGDDYKNSTHLVRCVRRSSDPIWTTPEGTVATIDLGAALNATVTATDDSGTVTYSKDSGAEWISVNSSTGELTGTAPGSATTASITITATDPSGNTATRTFDVVVEEPDACETGPVGTECGDGSFYIGLSPADGERVYMTGAAHEGSGIRFDSASCSYCGDGSVATSQTDGRANTNALLAFNATGFDAAAHCESLNAIEAHGYDDWYLPAGGSGSSSEINLIREMVADVGAVGGLTASTKTSGHYWSSTEYNNYYARYQRFGDGYQYRRYKDSTYLVRCVRR